MAAATATTTMARMMAMNLPLLHAPAARLDPRRVRASAGYSIGVGPVVAHQVSAVGPLRTTQVIGRSRYSEPPERLRLGLEPERSADAVERTILPGRSVVAEAMFLSVVTRHRLPELNIRHFACSPGRQCRAGSGSAPRTPRLS
jgi:hypothetical protein